MVVLWGIYDAFGIFFKPVLIEFGWTRAATSGAFSLSMILLGLLGILTGGLNDRFGPRLVMTIVGFLVGVGYLLMSQVSALWQFYLFYGVIIGIGMGGGVTPLLSTIARWFIKRRGTMTGIAMAGAGLGLLIASPVANWLISIYDWRMSYLMLGSIVFVVVVVAAQFLKRDPSTLGQRPYGENEVDRQGYKLETKSFTLREALGMKQFWLICGIFFSTGFCRISFLVHIVPHVTDLGISAATAANILAMCGGMTIIGRVLLGSFADRIGTRESYIIGFILLSAALLWLAFSTDVWMLYLFAAVFGLSSGTVGLGSPLIAGLFGLRSHGLIYGVTGLCVTIGGTLGPFVTGYIFDVSGSYYSAFLVCTAIAVIGLILAALLARTKRS